MSCNLDPDLRAVLDRVVTIQRDLHAHPELAFEEVRTAGVVADELRRLGLEPRTGIAKTGVSAMIEGQAGDGPTVLLRADMDALPLTEETGLPHSSTVPGKMHACGHDGHTAMLLGAAAVLVSRRARLKGRIKLVFQPAEEHPGGAKPMIEAGVLEHPKVDYALGLHLWAPLPTGIVAVGDGPVMAASDKFEITITGSGGHAAQPSLGVDPVLVGAQVVTALQSIVSRNVPATDAAVLSVTQFHAGEAFNVIPGSAWLCGTARSFNPVIRARLEARMKELVPAVAGGFGASAEVTYNAGYPPTINDRAAADVVRAAAAQVVGCDGVLGLEPIMGAEDFAYFLEAVPGCFFMVGIRNEAKGTGAPHHNARFQVDDDAFGIGIATMVGAAERLLS